MPAVQRLKLRAFLFLSYLLAMSVGVSTFIVPSATYRTEGGLVQTYIWSMMLLVGGAMSALDVLLGKWWIELSGLTLLITASLSFALVIISRIGPTTILPYSGFFVLMLTLTMVNRWLDVRRMYKSARRQLESTGRGK
jgi:hypothetical protein